MIENKVYFSKTLNMHYRHCIGGVIFEDKVTYTNEEISLIKKSKIPVQTIHTAKLYFDGAVIGEEALENLKNGYIEKGSDFHKAVDYASKLMKESMKGREAVYRASAKYNIAVSAIGAELGKRRRK